MASVKSEATQCLNKELVWLSQRQVSTDLHGFHMIALSGLGSQVVSAILEDNFKAAVKGSLKVGKWQPWIQFQHKHVSN